MQRKVTPVFFVLCCLMLGAFLTSGSVILAQTPELKSFQAPLDPTTANPPTTTDIGAASTTIFYVIEDATVQQGAPTSTAGNNNYLGVGYDDGSYYASGHVRSYLKFDLSGLTVDAIESATLYVYHAGGQDYPGTSRNVTFYRVAGNWAESTLTWNNRPNYAESWGSTSSTYDYTGWRSINVTNLVRNWVSGTQPNYGLVTIGPEGTQGIYRMLFSSETGYAAHLRITFRPTQPPVLDVAPGTLAVQVDGATTTALNISNVTSQSLDWTAGEVGSIPWLSLGSTSGANVTPTSPGQLILNIDPTGLTVGNTYSGQIRVSSNTAGVVGSPLTATVQIEVLDSLSQIYLPIILSGGSGSPAASNIVALVVGIADYQYLGPAPLTGNLPDDWGYDLVQPVHDAADFIALLENEYGTPANHIIHLGDPSSSSLTAADVGAQATMLGTRANFFAAFDQLDLLEDEDTTVVIFYSGHGGQITDQAGGDETDGFDEFIAMYDTNYVSGDYVRVITDDDLAILLDRLESEQIVVILDSCYSGGMMSTLTSLETQPLLRRGLANPLAANNVSAQDAMGDIVAPGRLIITGGTGDQSTWESPSLQNGVFTHYYLQALTQTINDANANGAVSFEEAYWFSREAIDDWVYEAQTEHQNPDISDQYLGQIEP